MLMQKYQQRDESAKLTITLPHWYGGEGATRRLSPLGQPRQDHYRVLPEGRGQRAAITAMITYIYRLNIN